MEKMLQNTQRERLTLELYGNNMDKIEQTYLLNYQGSAPDSHNSSTLNLKQEEQQGGMIFINQNDDLYQEMTKIKMGVQMCIKNSPLEQPLNSASTSSQVKFEETRALTSDKQNNNESLCSNNIILSNNSQQQEEIQGSDSDKNIQSPQINHSIKKTSKKKSGRPLKKNFVIAVKQKLMKEYEIENSYGSTFSSENYQLLVTAFLVFGQDSNNSNKYIVKKSSEGEKYLDLSEKLDQHLFLETKRMWLNFYKISKILNTNSKTLARKLWEEFEQFLVKLNRQFNEEQNQQREQMAASFEEYLRSQLQSVENLQNFFNQYECLSLILQDPLYFSFTQQCFNPMNYQKEREQNNEQKQIEYQDIEKTLLIQNNITKNDFIYIIFSCAVCDYSNIISPYFDLICNLL